MSLRDKILASDDIASELVEIPEWDVILEVRGMTGGDRSKILENAATNEGNISVGTVYVDTVIASTYDPDTGERVFAESDKPALMEKSAAAIDRLATVGMRLSAMDQNGVDDAKKGFPEETVP